MKNAKKNLAIFAAGFLLCAGLCSIIIISSVNRADEYQKQRDALRAVNQQLRDSIRDREDTITGLQYSVEGIRELNRRFEESTSERQRTLEEARSVISSTGDSISKLEALLRALEKMEQAFTASERGSTH